VAVIVVSLTTVKFASATPPKVTPLAPVKPVPVMVTLVPPSVLPLAGVTLVTIGPCKITVTTTSFPVPPV
jgi:hypothetical protein